MVSPFYGMDSSFQPSCIDKQFETHRDKARNLITNDQVTKLLTKVGQLTWTIVQISSYLLLLLGNSVTLDRTNKEPFWQDEHI